MFCGFELGFLNKVCIGISCIWYKVLKIMKWTLIQNYHFRQSLPARFDHKWYSSILVKKPLKMNAFKNFQLQDLTKISWLPSLFLMVWGSILSIILEKWQNFRISAFWSHLQENGHRYSRMALRNSRDGSNS